jgi:SAM-dependent methyltransferase
MQCTDCCHTSVECVGPTLSFGQYAGGALVSQPFGTVNIFRCGHCQLVFKSPPLDLSTAHELYNQVDGSVWSSRMPRPEFDLAQLIVESQGESGLSVLDVGCNRGEFMQRVRTDVQRFGVEVNRTAAAFAESQGVKVWPDVGAISPGVKFRFITCFDVIEHVPRPSEFVFQLLDRLEPGGCLIVSSGDAAVFLSQRRPAVNWYFANPEHISFISEDWIRFVLPAPAGFVVSSVTRFIHGHHRLGLDMRTKVGLFKLWPTAYLRSYQWAKRLAGSKSGLFVPGNGSAADHACFVITNTAGLVS